MASRPFDEAPPPEPRYSVETHPLSDEEREQAAAPARRELDRVSGRAARRALLVVWLMTSLIGLPAYFFVAPPANLPLAILCPLGGLLVAWLLRRQLARGARAWRARLDAVEKATTRQEHTLDLRGPHLFARHEHGVLLLVPIGPSRTFFRDISSCSDDPWDTPVSQALEAGQVHFVWTWSEVAGEPVADPLVMTGETIVPNLRPDFASAEEENDFVDWFGDEWLPADYVAKVDFEYLLRADAEIQERHAKPKRGS